MNLKNKNVLIVGKRKTGKTTLMQTLAHNNPRHFLYEDDFFIDPDAKENLQEPFVAAVQYPQKLPHGLDYILLLRDSQEASIQRMYSLYAKNYMTCFPTFESFKSAFETATSEPYDALVLRPKEDDYIKLQLVLGCVFFPKSGP